MTDTSSRHQKGYTKGGKTLKQVRRYYALKDASRKRGSPRERARSPNNREQTRRRTPSPASPSPPPSPPSDPPSDENESDRPARKRRSPADDGLAKRIALELKVQQEAIEMRGKRHPKGARRSAVQPIYIKPVEGGGPIFVTETPMNKSLSPRQQERAKSAKALNELNISSIVKVLDAVPQQSQAANYTSNFGVPFSCLTLSLIYITTSILLLIAEKIREPPSESEQVMFPEDTNLITVNLAWLSITSVVIVIGDLYWWLQPRSYGHLIACLIVMILAALSTFGSIIYRMLEHNEQVTYKHPKTTDDSSINYWLPTIFLVLQCLNIFRMVEHMRLLLSRQLLERSRRPASPASPTSPTSPSPPQNADTHQLSMFMSPYPSKPAQNSKVT